MHGFRFWLSEKLTKRIYRNRTEEILEENTSTSDRILDLGSAGKPYHAIFPHAIGLDIANVPGVNLVGDAHHLPFKNASFDMVIATEVLEHFEKPWEAVAEITRVLRPGGKLILSTRFIYPIHSAPHDYYRFTRYALKSLFKAWEITLLEEDNYALDTIALLLQALGHHTKTKPGFVRFFFFVAAKIIDPLGQHFVVKTPEKSKAPLDSQVIASGYVLVALKSNKKSHS